jgi:hypothetical protein
MSAKTPDHKTVQRVLVLETTLNIEACLYNHHPELVQPYLDVVGAARAWCELIGRGVEVEISGFAMDVWITPIVPDPGRYLIVPLDTGDTE